MSNCFSFNTQLASIMEVLANAAVAEICKLVDDGYAVLQLEISRSQKENETLKRKMRELESSNKHGCEVKREGSERRPSGNCPSDVFQVCDTQSGIAGAVDQSYGSNEDVCLWEDREVTPTDDPCSPVMNTNVQLTSRSGKEEGPESVCIKEEMLEDDLQVRDQEDEVKITGDTMKMTAPKSNDGPAKHNSGRNGSKQGSIFKEEMENEMNRRQMEVKGDTGEVSNLGALPSDSITDEETQKSICMYELENQTVCTEAHVFSLNDKSSLLGGAHIVHCEDKEREEFALGNITVFRSNSHLTMGEGAASKSDIFHANGWVSGDDHLVKPRSVMSHCRAGTRGRQFICTYCGKDLACLKNLKKHQRMHTGKKPFTCTQCGKSFIFSSHLTRHQRVHTGEKPFTCTQCGKSFADLSKLKQHHRVHTGENLFTCTQCGKSFIFSSHLMRHQMVHTGEKPFLCTQCGKSFTRLSNLKVHQRVHTSRKLFTCTQCEKSFADLSKLEQHRRVHTGEHCYLCRYCGKRFSQSGTLTVHLQTHMDEKLLSCT